MKKLIFLLALLLNALFAAGQMKWNSTYQQYINQYKDLAIEQMKKYRIPASITLAQGVFESGAGRSELARKGNNHFGIKCHGWQGLTVHADDDERNECFRAYDNSYQSYEDHSRFLVNGQRYRKLFSLSTTDYKGWARGLKAAGYATNPRYADKLIELIELYKLHQYDKAKHYDRFMASATKDVATDGKLHPIYKFNNNYYLKARRGDTFKSIGKEVGISYRKLAKYNEREKRDVLQEGDIVYLKKKAKKAPKDYKGRLHYVRSGESMYSIAQLYGIRLKYLYKLNRMSPDDTISVGQGLRLR